jgi:predicted aspartyl protease
MENYKPFPVMEIEHAGPIIDVIIRPVRGSFSGLRARGLIDTGATDVLISPAIASKLGLSHVNDDVMNVVGGGELDSKVYSGYIEVAELEFKKILPLHAVPWRQTSHTILLGREFLRYFIFNYDGPRGMFHFSRPIDTHEALENFDD